MEDEEIIHRYSLEYHNFVFYYLHIQLEKSDVDPCSYHPIRNLYWANIPESTYDSNKGIKLMNGYLNRLEDEICQIISKNSIGYWLHLLRRISCTLSECGDDRERSSVIGLVRAVFEASIQKYGMIDPCNKIEFTNNLDISDILDGFLTKDKFKKVIKSHINNPCINLNETDKKLFENYLNDTHELIVEFIDKKPQLVLTQFGINELKEFYNLENLMFEIWRSTANLRGLNKGASLIVEHNPGDVFEVRDDFLAESIHIYDERCGNDIETPFTSKGTYYTLNGEDNWPWLYIAQYNIGKIDTKPIVDGYYESLGKPNITIGNGATNFVWSPINMLNYNNSNKNYFNDFNEVNGVSFESVIVVFTSILIRAWERWSEPDKLLKCWHRGYEGPYNKNYIINELEKYLPTSMKYHDLKSGLVDLEKGFQFWSLTQDKKENIDLLYPGPHSIFLPYGERYFIDYAWMDRRLFDLFWKCTEDENFKGTALELLIQDQGKMVLPTKECKSFNGDKRQIDASFGNKNTLLIVECKVVGKSIDFDRGTKKALDFRMDKYEKAIDQVDEKANWLINKIKGTNFDISNYNKIIPIVITPYIEYILYEKRKYWLTDSIPRILTPAELKELLIDNEFWKSEENVLYMD